jgi:hypothetical protein
MDMGLDPRPTLDAAWAECLRSRAIDPNYAGTHSLLGSIALVRARDAFERGGEVALHLQEATREIDAALAINPLSADAAESRASIALVEARAHAARDEDPTAAFVAAEAAIDRGRQLVPKNRWQHDAVAELSVERATWSLAHGKPTAGWVDRGLAAAREILADHPFSPHVVQLQGKLHLVAARAAHDPAERASQARAAVDALETAVRMNGHLARTANPLLADARPLAEPR